MTPADRQRLWFFFALGLTHIAAFAFGMMLVPFGIVMMRGSWAMRACLLGSLAIALVLLADPLRDVMGDRKNREAQNKKETSAGATSDGHGEHVNDPGDKTD